MQEKIYNIRYAVNDAICPRNYELDEDSTSAKFALVQKEKNRETTRNVSYYNLDVVISVGYKTNSDRAIILIFMIIIDLIQMIRYLLQLELVMLL